MRRFFVNDVFQLNIRERNNYIDCAESSFIHVVVVVKETDRVSVQIYICVKKRSLTKILTFLVRE